MNFLFDPELNVFLQTFEVWWLTALMLVVSAFGSSVFLTAAAGFLLFRFSLKKGILLIHILIWSLLLTDFIKALLSLPRPSDVNPSISIFENQYPQWLLNLFPLRMNAGFPSGHVCSSTVFWGATMFFFPGRLQWILGTLLVCFMPLSRIYLGRHFLGDVMGGFILATFILFVGKFVLLPTFGKFYERQNRISVLQGLPSLLLFLYLFVLPLILLLFVPLFEANDVGKLFGINVALSLLFARGFPEERQSRVGGFLRFAMAAVFYNSMKLLFLTAAKSAPAETWFYFLAGALPAVVSIWAVLKIGKRTGLYQDPAS